MNRPVITLTSDFGHGPFVGIMKGVMLAICPDAVLVDICHTVKPQDVQAGAMIIEQAMTAFGQNTAHLCVVDPGVGTNRRAIAVRALGMYFVGPDNGLLSAPLLADAKAEVRLLENQEFFRIPISGTFHGRDIFAPCAARLVYGASLAEMGPKVSDPVILTMPQPKQTADEITGEIIGVDDFGNLTSNIKAEVLDALLKGQSGEVTLHLFGETIVVPEIIRAYGLVEAGDFAAVIDSMGRLELSINKGSLAQRISHVTGDLRGLSVSVKRRQD